MKMPTLPKMKMPKLPKLPKPQPKRLQATARRAAQPVMDDYDEEPTTRLSSAFIVVLILHVVAVGGIYAFNSIKAHRRGLDPVPAQPQTSQPKAGQPLASAPSAQTADQPSTNVSTSAAPGPASAQVASTAVAPISGSRIHHVKSGDTLSRVAALYSVGVTDLEQANALKAGTVLRAGQTLNIPAAKASGKSASDVKKSEAAPTAKNDAAVKQASAAAASPSGAATTYTVKKGDNPVAIAKKFHVSYDELLKLNKIDDPKKLRIDQTLKIPAKKSE